MQDKSEGRVPKKKTTKVRTVGRVFLTHTFAKKKVWTKIFRVGRSDFDVHTYKIMQNPKYGYGTELFLVVWNGFFYTLSHR